MCYESKTFRICHKLTSEGEQNYRKMLEEEADKILWRHAHPIKAFFRKLFFRDI